VEEDILDMSGKERKKRGIKLLPNSLENAIREFEKSKLMREVLGNHIFETLIANKWVEWDKYRMQVTDYEIKEYFPWL